MILNVDEIPADPTDDDEVGEERAGLENPQKRLDTGELQRRCGTVMSA